MRPTIDSAEFPIVHITYPSVMTEADVDAYAIELGEVLAQGPIATIVDIRAVDPNAGGAAGRKYLAAAVDDVTGAHRGQLIAEAIVIDSTILRGLYTAYCWIRTDSTYPSKAFPDVQKAEVWVRERLDSSHGSSR